MILLNELPKEHELRNTPLGLLKVKYLPKGAVVWREVYSSFGIAKVTYNQLSEVWTKHDRFAIM